MLNSNKIPANKTCPKCGKTFSCITHENCWCEDEVHLSRETLKKIRIEYIDCLCKDCLNYYANIEQKGLSTN